jgi:hypothetical protein
MIAIRGSRALGSLRDALVTAREAANIGAHKFLGGVQMPLLDFQTVRARALGMDTGQRIDAVLDALPERRPATGSYYIRHCPYFRAADNLGDFPL